MGANQNGIAAVFNNVSKGFVGPDGSFLKAIDGLSLELRSGDWFYVLGQNGSGKSTLLRLLSGDLIPDEGECRINQDLQSHTRYVEQGVLNNLVPSMTILENMLLTRWDSEQRMPSLRLAKSGEGVQAIRNALALFGMGLESRLNVKVGHLSGGQQQAVVAARVLASGPKLLLLDEFTSALDLRVSKQVLGVVRDYAKQNGVTVVSVTHDLHQVEGQGGRIIVLDGGHVKSYIDLSERPLTAREIAEFVYG